MWGTSLDLADPQAAHYLLDVAPDEAVIGKLATVTHPIAPGRAGEVLVHIRGGTETYMAVCDEEVGQGREVLVIGQRSARTVEVTPFVA